ncbi:AraC-like DNA-binding protein [Bacillus tianshenii]|uniref:AraC-like DNA-binding protein n=1 Tax=Sutcliffiella tianshenii TaxID=1463404 RepID=A0ABS2P2U0_9BACI|nr:helix-turn-helix domain-containing protein [Bacillus tianshenii]MBM7620938.1 AraC-like DNA-binding protein [Bacillus tianshenii]
MIYQIKRPDKRLQPWVECYWHVQLHTGKEGKRETILPNGKVEMIFALEGDYRVGNRRTYRMKHAWLSGLQEEPLHIEYNGASNLIGIRFHPSGLFPFLHIPISETVNEVEPLEMIWGSFAAEIFENLSETGTIGDIFCKLDNYLQRKINGEKENQHSLIKKLINEISIMPTLSFSLLAEEMGYSERHLNRIFKDMTGISPKLLAQIFRFEKASMELFKSPAGSVGSAAMDLGYYDQSHFIREFKRFSGMTPGEYKKKAIASNNFL